MMMLERRLVYKAPLPVPMQQFGFQSAGIGKLLRTPRMTKEAPNRAGGPAQLPGQLELSRGLRNYARCAVADGVFRKRAEERAEKLKGKWES